MGIHGAFAEYLELPFVTDDSLMAFPDSIGFRDLAMLEPLSVGLGLAKKVRTRDKVVAVLGQDLVGLATVAFLKKRGVERVITCDVSQKRLKASKEVGADLAIDSLNEDVVQAIMKDTMGDGVDVALIIDARPIIMFQAMSAVRRAGSIWYACHYRGPLQLSPSAVHSARYAVGAEYNGEIEPALSYDPNFFYMRSAFGNLGPRIPRWIEVIELIKSGLITAEKYVTHVFPLEETAKAFELAMNPHETIRVMVEM